MTGMKRSEVGGGIHVESIGFKPRISSVGPAGDLQSNSVTREACFIQRLQTRQTKQFGVEY